MRHVLPIVFQVFSYEVAVMGYREEINEILAQAESAPATSITSTYERKAQMYAHLALKKVEGTGNWRVGNCQCLVISNLGPIMPEIKIWSVILIEDSRRNEEQVKVQNCTFVETLDQPFS
jgi:hypothetical protein